MIKLNRTTEYGLMALRHMNKKGKTSAELTSAREVADEFGLPFEITAKTLQRMKETGLIQSAQGARGGYVLQRSLEDVTLAEFLELMEGPQALVACANHLPLKEETANSELAGGCGCEYHGKCGLKNAMSDLNSKVRNFLSGIKLADLSETDLTPSGLSLSKIEKQSKSNEMEL